MPIPKFPLGQTFTVKLTVQFPELVFICGEMVGTVVIADALPGGNKTCDDKFGYCWTK